MRGRSLCDSNNNLCWPLSLCAVFVWPGGKEGRAVPVIFYSLLQHHLLVNSGPARPVQTKRPDDEAGAAEWKLQYSTVRACMCVGDCMSAVSAERATKAGGGWGGAALINLDI